MALHLLKTTDVMRPREPGKVSDGGGLYLIVRGPAVRSWVLLATVSGKRKEIALGPAAGPDKPGLSLADARTKAAAWRAHLTTGAPLPTPAPAPVPMIPADVKTFGQVAAEWFDGVFVATEKTKRDNRSLVKRHAATLTHKDIRAITKHDVLAVLQPIWGTVNRSATDLRFKLDAIFAYAAAKDYRPEDAPNPADWKVLKNLLPDATPFVEHHESVPYAELPGVFAAIRAKDSTAARALAFVILTASRTTEVRGARWQEIDGNVWTCPADRMKVKKVRDRNGKMVPAPAHRVPLSSQALALLESIRPADAKPEDLIFPGIKPGAMLNINTMNFMLRTITDHGTPHGMRASFSTWRAEKTEFSERLSEIALAHAVKTQSEAAYDRSDYLEARRPLMQAWADYLHAANVT